MKTYPIKNVESGELFAFEVRVLGTSISRIVGVLAQLGATDIHTRRLFGRPRDVHVRFVYEGVKCMVWEPYGDSSRYWIGPEDESDRPNLAKVEEAFREQAPSILQRILAVVGFG